MTNSDLSGAASKTGRLAGRIARRLIGLFLLAIAIGLTTCQALDAVKTPLAPTHIEHSGD